MYRTFNFTLENCQKMRILKICKAAKISSRIGGRTKCITKSVWIVHFSVKKTSILAQAIAQFMPLSKAYL